LRKYLQQSEVNFTFIQTKEDFFVEELPYKEFSGHGKNLILKVQKQSLTTWDMVAIFAKKLNIDPTTIGYAGLKDKHATTIQYLSFDKRLEKSLQKFHHKQIKILESFYDTNRITMGDLAGNLFRINLYDIDPKGVGKLEKTAHKVLKNGLANYFGYQRFGNDPKNIEYAKEMAVGEHFVEDPKMRKFLVSVYQSYLFNEWLKERVAMSKEGKYLLLKGDVYVDKNQKYHTPTTIPAKDVVTQKLLPTGLLPGRGVFKAKFEAREIEKKYDDGFVMQKGYRREAIIFPKNLDVKYKAKEKKATITFSLPKGSYATVFLEALAGKELGKIDQNS